jgi:predicted RNase H-like HicB family nuclease
MRYPIVIEEGTETAAFGVVVPDLPGCFSAGDTLDEAMANVEEAAAAWIDATLDAGAAVPPPSSLEDIKGRPEYKGWAFGVVLVDPSSFDDTTTRINVSLPVRVLKRLDAKVRDSGEKDRSAYIAKMAIG